MAEVITTPSEKMEEAIVLTPEQAADIWGTNVKPKEEVKQETTVEEEKVEEGITISSLLDHVEEPEKPSQPQNTSLDFSKIFEKELLFPFQDKDGNPETPKTVEELEELISANKEEWKKEILKEYDTTFKSKYSPQIQSIIDYAENGGTNVEPLLQSWAKAEQVSALDESKEDQAEKIIRAYRESLGDEQEVIEEEIQMLKDSNKLKDRAAKYKPKLIEVEEERINAEISAQQQRDQIAKKAIEQYKNVVRTTLEKDKLGVLPLDKTEKELIFDLTIPNKYKTYNGRGSGFDKILEDLQFGDKQDYEHFLQIVKFASDKEGFIKSLTNEIKKDTTTQVVKQLKTAKSTSSNFEDPNKTSKNVKMLTRVKGMGN